MQQYNNEFIGIAISVSISALVSVCFIADTYIGYWNIGQFAYQCTFNQNEVITSGNVNYIMHTHSITYLCTYIINTYSVCMYKPANNPS